MSSHAHRQLDQQLNSERNRKILLLVTGATILFVVAGLFVPLSFTNLHGTTVSHHTTKTQYGPAPTATIQLDNGDNVEAVWPRQKVFDPQTTVQVMQSTTLFGRSTYRVSEQVQN